MAHKSEVTVRGFLAPVRRPAEGEAPEYTKLRFLQGSGVAAAEFRLIATERVRDRQTGEYRDGDTIGYTVEAYRRLAENLAETLEKGLEVEVTGRLKVEEYTTREGEKRTALKIVADEVSIPLSGQTAKVKPARGQGNQAGQAPAAPSAPAAPAAPYGQAPQGYPDPAQPAYQQAPQGQPAAQPVYQPAPQGQPAYQQAPAGYAQAAPQGQPAAAAVPPPPPVSSSPAPPAAYDGPQLGF